MALINQPPQTPVDQNGAVSMGWATFFSAAFSILDALTMSGPTASRPVKFLWIGRNYFDVTLGKPVWLRSVGPNVWVDGVGTVS